MCVTRLVLLAALLTLRPCAAALTDGLRLYVPFDGSAAPAFALGPADVEIGAAFFVDGRVDAAANVVGTADVTLSALGNFHRPRGTVSFWHLPDWDPREGDDGHRMLLQQSNFQLTWYRNSDVLFFMTGDSKPGRGFRWDYSVASKVPLQWELPAWHHFVITWDSATGQKALWLDGERVAAGETEWMRSTEPGLGEPVALGSPTAPGRYDEWAIWDRPLTDDEIASLFVQPEAAAATLHGAPPPADAAPAPVAFELHRLLPASTIVAPGEPFTLPTVAHNRLDQPLDLPVRLTLIDALDRVGRTWEDRLALAAGEAKPLAYELTAERLGVHKLRLEGEWEGRPFVADLGSFAVWPRDALEPTPESFFGHHINSWFDGQFIHQAARLGLSWQRNHNMLQTTWWPRVQPTPGEFEWTLDFQLAYCAEAGMPVLGQLFGTPGWAADPPLGEDKPGSYPRGAVPQMEAFERYVRETVERYKETIHVWEVWNEPEVSMFWQGTPEQFGALAQAATRAAKAVDPTCTVLIGGFTFANEREWYERVGEAGGFAGADGIGFHGYAPSVDQLRAKIDLGRYLADAYGPADRPFLLVNSEWGVNDTTFLIDATFPELPPRRLLPSPSYLRGAAQVVQMDALALSQGVQRSFYYLHNEVGGPGAYQNGSAIEYTRTPRPKLMARTAFEALVRGHETVEFMPGPAMLGVVLFGRHDGTSAAVAWLVDSPPMPLSTELPPGTQVLDLFGNPLSADEPARRLSDVPVYFDSTLGVAELRQWLHERL